MFELFDVQELVRCDEGLTKVHQCLKGTDIKNACVAGAFPSGLSPLSLRVKEVKYAIDHGADEIDMVISPFW